MSMIGKTLGTFECAALLGKGGMGEVYRAKDQKLGRDVAIKVLPEEFAKDADRVARFQREAKLLASLNHPNIAAIHGLEESEGTHFLVLELIEGDTLADRLKRGAIPVEESLKLALQIAEALEAAHEKGVIHRDLKPANIKVTPDGKVKVLDFGLAKAFAGDSEDMNLSNSPTLSAAATQQGVILGTAAYMSPEQARGDNVDKGADIWAFGAVLFEMLTGRQVFGGKTVSDTLASVLAREPEWKSLPLNLHPRIRLLLERCLKKEPKDRYGAISDARVDIQEVLADPSGVFVQPVATAKPRKVASLKLPWVAAAVILSLIVAGIAGWILKPIPPPEPKRVMRFDYELPEGQQFHRSLDGQMQYEVAVSPDGSKFAYSTTGGLYLRYIESLDARLIAGADKDTLHPFFSPDGLWVGYFSLLDQKLKKVAINGGAPVVICDTSVAIVMPSWDTKDTIVYSDIISGIMRVPANGGTPETLVKGSLADVAKEGFAIAPQILPDEKTLLFTNVVSSGAANNQIVIQSLETGDRTVLFNGAAARYLSTGHIIYSLTNNNTRNFFAVPFDLDKLEVKGGSVSILEGAIDTAFSDSGTLVYVPQPAISSGFASGSMPSGRLVWVDKQGKEELLAAKPDLYFGKFDISPDGTRVALSVGGPPNSDIWIWDFNREASTRLTFDEGIDGSAIWTPDSQKIIYASSHESGMPNSIWLKAADGTGEAEKLYSGEVEYIFPFSSSRDGKTIALWELSLSPIQTNIATLSMEGDYARTPLLQESYNEGYPRISPDGRWVAYQSNESGKYEVFVHSFPDVNQGRWQISTNGGHSPLWSPDGKELFYRSGDSFMAIEVETEPAFKCGKPKVLFRGTYLSMSLGSLPIEQNYWDIHPDGDRFLMIKPTATTMDKSTEEGSVTTAPQPKIIVVLNWFEELKERVPTD